MRTSEDQKTVANAIQDGVEYNQRDLEKLANELGIKDHVVKHYARTHMNRVSRGVYAAGSVGSNVVELDQGSNTDFDMLNGEVYVPSKDETFVEWGFYKDVKKIIQSGMFFPIYISGLSGNGKTFMVEQACAALNREYVRVQISPETDEEDLLGGMRLVEGSTIFEKGPVVKAMEAGAVLLIDEIDRGTNKLMALQGVLEGKPVLLKKTGEVVTPKPGFTVFATANTKGSGSDDGRYVSATIMDDALLERFVASFDQEYPDRPTEKRILVKHMNKFGEVDEDFADKLAVWAGSIRKAFDEGSVEDVISTRRLCHIVQTNSIFSDRKKAVELCTSRFDTEVREAFIDLYNSVDKEEEENDTSSSTTTGTGAW